MKDFPVAIASYSFHAMHGEGRCDIFDYLDMLRYRYQLHHADIWCGYLPTLEDGFIAKVRRAMDDRDITLANLCVDGPYVWCDDPDERAAHKKDMLAYIRAAGALGAKTIRIDFGGTDDTPMHEEGFDYLVKTYREYCAMCGDMGMKIGPENHWGWDRVPENLDRVRRAVDSPYYGHLYHLRNLKGDVEKGEEICISYAMHTHIHAPSMPYAKDVIRRLAASGYQGVYSVEHHSGRLECERVAWQLATLQEMLAELKEEGLEQPAVRDYAARIYLDGISTGDK